MGSKIGYVSKDNGWATFKNVRIPRKDMLQGFCEISKDGEFQITGDLRVLYTVMMTIRMLIVQMCGKSLLMSAKVGIRYACVRRQFKTYHGKKEERKLIDYQQPMHTFAA